MDFAAENKIRQRVLSMCATLCARLHALPLTRRAPRSFNKREEEFPTLQAYNDYLEEVEDIGACATSRSCG